MSTDPDKPLESPRADDCSGLRLTGGSRQNFADVPPDIAEETLGTLFEFLRRELRTIAAGRLRRAGEYHSFSPTDLLHEAYIRLDRQFVQSWKSEADFKAAFAGTCRRIVLDYFRHRNAEKRGGDRKRVYFDSSPFLATSQTVDVLALDEALNDLAALSAKRAKIVELRYFGGLSEGEIAEQLGISRATVQRRWQGARAFLAKSLET